MSLWGFKTTADEVKRIDLAVLKKFGYLSGWARRSINWTCRGESTGWIMAEVATDDCSDGPYMKLDYKI